MNKLTPRTLRDLHSTLPEGTECYLCGAARKALAKYRNGNEPILFLTKDKAVSALTQTLGRGLKRFLRQDIRSALSAYQEADLKKMA